MIVEVMFAVVALISGIVLLVYSSDKAVDYSVKIALAFGFSPLMIGLILVSIGTDLPEVATSIISSAVGHPDINVGDSVGSVLNQITLVLGLLAFLGGKFEVNRKEVLATGVCEVLALILSVSIAEKGYFTRINALFLLGSWPVFIFLIRSILAKNAKETEHLVASEDESSRHRLRDWVIALLGFIGVAVGSFMVIESIITLSKVLNVPEYFISFFVVAMGTSLPELVVDLTAIRKKQYKLAIGDVIGSCIFDASFSIGIGLVFFPQAISGDVVAITGLYAVFCSVVVISMLALREKVDKKAGALFILLYLLSYILLQT